MNTKELIIKVRYCGEGTMFPDDIMYISFHRGEHKAFNHLDGGWCTHTQFQVACDMIELGYFATIKEYIKDELHITADKYTLVKIYPTKDGDKEERKEI